MNDHECIVQRDRCLETAADWLLRLREDPLSEAEVAAWIDWCESNPENLDAFAEVQALWQAAEKPATKASEPMPRRRGPRTQWLRWSALAASIAAVILASTVLILSTGPGTPSPSALLPIATRDVVQTPTAMNRRAMLPDGSHVEIGARTTLDVEFTMPQRRLNLRAGEAFFKVKHDAARPFIVEAGDVHIQAIGTAFDVRRSGDEVEVTVAEGAVEASKGLEQGVRVQAGEQVLFQNGSPVRRSLVDPGHALAWRTGRLEYAGDSLGSIVATVNRYSSRSIVLADPTLRDLTFTGTIFLGSIEGWLEGLEQVFPVTVRHNDEGSIEIARREDTP